MVTRPLGVPFALLFLVVFFLYGLLMLLLSPTRWPAGSIFRYPESFKRQYLDKLGGPMQFRLLGALFAAVGACGLFVLPAALPEALGMMARGELLLLGAAALCAASASALSVRMVARVNRMLPQVQRQSYLRWVAIRPLHRQMYPRSWMVAAVNLYIAAGVVCLAIVMFFF